ncbi:hypothetical protein [Chelatococcus asaccharovorans]|uniref:hypothetical protein n=1 Tax=Chelatococcus asaccharovorans TaxID=28210 RepID=UPI00224C6701|nr:hypothetical protein [Chelatococcus asaccharovorans]CAH1650384.1 hypothetical protein CHELA17_20273 [Chelatococcus asaccharovorans]CAH1692243.1 hypothetical protein CHELA40_50310 [Chelatococcus asaccharovorans]
MNGADTVVEMLKACKVTLISGRAEDTRPPPHALCGLDHDISHVPTRRRALHAVKTFQRGAQGTAAFDKTGGNAGNP